MMKSNARREMRRAFLFEHAAGVPQHRGRVMIRLSYECLDQVRELLDQIGLSRFTFAW
jgi:hypothetical protein